MVAPQLESFDLWYASLDEDADDGDVLGFLNLLAKPLQATAKGAPLPDVISVSYGECEPVVAPYTASRTSVWTNACCVAPATADWRSRRRNSFRERARRSWSTERMAGRCTWPKPNI